MSSSDLAVSAAQDALEHTRKHLFPFDFGKWIGLGLVAFLDQCGRSGGGGVPSGGSPQVPAGPGGDTGGVDEALQWLAAHALVVAAVVIGALVLIVALTALVQWINARGVFMYVAAVVRGRAEIGRDWAENAGPAWSYFQWTFGLGLGFLALVLLILATGGVALVGYLRSGGILALLVLVGLGFSIFALALVGGLLFLALRDFVAPLQRATGLACGPALALFRDLLRANLGAFVIYVLLKMVLAIAIGVVTCLAMCLTCCLAAVPVISQTLLQPIFFAERAWPLFLLRRLGHDVFPPAGD